MERPDCTHTIANGATLARRRAGRELGLSDAIHDALRALVDQVIVWQERSRQRRHLARLSDHMLRDIGLSRGDVWSECRKPFWRP